MEEKNLLEESSMFDRMRASWLLGKGGKAMEKGNPKAAIEAWTRALAILRNGRMRIEDTFFIVAVLSSSLVEVAKQVGSYSLAESTINEALADWDRLQIANSSRYESDYWRTWRLRMDEYRSDLFNQSQ